MQKAPQLIESVKAVYDQYEKPRFLLLGSSQILLMEQVRESLAGRCELMELFPLTLPEMMTESWEEPVEPSRLIRWLQGVVDPSDLPPVLLADERMSKAVLCFDRYLKQIKNSEMRAQFYHLRTVDGREVDLLVEVPEGFYAFEIKQRAHVRVIRRAPFEGVDSDS